MYIRWNESKNAELVARYGFGFERIIVALTEDSLLLDQRHPNKNRYAHQRQLLVVIEGYIYVVPYVENEEEVFFKTFYPSRKLTKKFLHHDR